MTYHIEADRFGAAASTRQSPAVEAVALTSAMVSDTVDLATYAKALRVWNGGSSAITLLVTPLGAASDASVAVDMEGTARTAGGMSVTPRDLARVGEMMRQGGTADGRRVVPEAWVRDTTSAGSAEAWQRGAMAFLFPQGRYRNKWYQTGAASGAYCGIGIHGQWLYIDPNSEVVIAKMSSQPLPVDDPLDGEIVTFLDALSRMA